MITISIYKKQREQIKNTIIHTAIDLFREKGYENVSIDEITKRVEIAKGTFYNYFKSKGDLLMHWSAERFSKVDIQGAINKEKIVEENLRYLLMCYSKAIADDHSLFVSFIKELGARKQAKTEVDEDFDFTGLLKAVISNSCDGARILSDKFELKVQVLDSAVYSAMVSWACSEKDVNGLGEHLSEVARICLYGMLN